MKPNDGKVDGKEDWLHYITSHHDEQELNTSLKDIRGQ